VIRPARLLVLTFGGLAMGLGIFFAFGWAKGPTDALDYILAALLLGPGVVGTIHYLWFYRVSMDDTCVEQVKYFGLVKKSVSILELANVDMRETRLGGYVPLRNVVVQFRWPQGLIELLATSYWTRDIRSAVKHLMDRGVPVNATLLRELGLHESQVA
jgi:hypothetical protein